MLSEMHHFSTHQSNLVEMTNFHVILTEECGDAPLITSADYLIFAADNFQEGPPVDDPRALQQSARRSLDS